MTINLLPWREQRQKKQIVKFIILSVTGLLVMGTSIGLFRFYLMDLQKKYRLKNLQLAEKIQSTPINDSLQSLNLQYQSVSQQIEIIRQVDQQKNNFWQEIKLLQNKLPAGIQLNNLTWRHSLLELQGESRFREEDVNHLIKLLEQLDLFTAVNLHRMYQHEKSSADQFIIHALTKDSKHV